VQLNVKQAQLGLALKRGFRRGHADQSRRRHLSRRRLRVSQLFSHSSLFESSSSFSSPAASFYLRRPKCPVTVKLNASFNCSFFREEKINKFIFRLIYLLN
jgi:hypothetical protein